jgi:hypothetical protein
VSTSKPYEEFIQCVARAVWELSPIDPALIKTLARQEPPAIEPPAPIPAPINANAASETIDEYCRRNKISRSTYVEERKRGRGPREERFGRAVRIPPQNETVA